MQKIFPLHCKISLTIYTRTVQFFLLQIQFFRVFNTQNLPVLLTLETVCSTPVQPLSSVSGHKRYNTLDFASKIVCQQGLCPLWIPLPTGMLLAPIVNPEPKDFSSEHLLKNLRSIKILRFTKSQKIYILFQYHFSIKLFHL